jgi:DNA-nicking Smr family endonuclease
MSGKKSPPWNSSMKNLGELVQKAGLRLRISRAAPISATRGTPVDPPVPKAEKPREATEEELFTAAMDGVARASWRHLSHPSGKRARRFRPDPELEDRRLMQQALDEATPIAIPEHPEYIEGWVGGIGKRFLPNLRNGLYSIQGQIDLHGMTRAEAEIAVEEYVIRMSRYRSCCVKIIHGRGINSPADRATLKESLQRLLSTRRMSKYVLAYASAPARDGGVGAVYVLLGRG